MVKPPAQVQTLLIDQEIVRLSDRKRPRLLFIPTASEDNADYCRAIRHLYEQLGCQVSELLLYRDRPTHQTMRKMIASAHIIYVGGGNTLRMMKLWRRLGIDRWLDQARRKGTVLCGLSAGAICWFRQGNSDSRKFSDETNKTLIKVSGLDFADLLMCPHYDVERHRQPALKEMMRRTKGVAVALDNCAAIEIINDRYRILSSGKNRHAWKVCWHRGEYIRQKLPAESGFRSMQGLLEPA